VQAVNQDVPVPFAPRGAASPDFIHRLFPHPSVTRSSGWPRMQDVRHLFSHLTRWSASIAVVTEECS
jgi:hypothetical protein